MSRFLFLSPAHAFFSTGGTATAAAIRASSPFSSRLGTDMPGSSINRLTSSSSPEASTHSGGTDGLARNAPSSPKQPRSCGRMCAGCWQKLLVGSAVPQQPLLQWAAPALLLPAPRPDAGDAAPPPVLCLFSDACRPALFRAATSAAGLMIAGLWCTDTIFVTTMTSTDITPGTLSRMLWISLLSMGPAQRQQEAETNTWQHVGGGSKLKWQVVCFADAAVSVARLMAYSVLLVVVPTKQLFPPLRNHSTPHTHKLTADCSCVYPGGHRPTRAGCVHQLACLLQRH